MNNCDVCGEYTNMLLSTLAEELQCKTKTEKEKLESCLSGFTSVANTFSSVRDYGLQQIKSSVVKPRVVPWVDNFLSVSHQLSFVRFSCFFFLILLTNKFINFFLHFFICRKNFLVTMRMSRSSGA